LELGYSFNQSVNKLPNIKYLQIEHDVVDLVDNLPNSLEELVLGYYFGLQLDNLPNQLKKIYFKNEYDDCDDDDYDNNKSGYQYELNNLPESIEIIVLSKYYEHKICKLPKNLKIIGCSQCYKFLGDLILLCDRLNLSFDLDYSFNIEDTYLDFDLDSNMDTDLKLKIMLY
jgi:hypothetical protein